MRSFIGGLIARPGALVAVLGSAVGGVALSLAIYFALLEDAKDRERAEFEREARTYSKSIQDGIDESLDVLHGLAGFYAASKAVTKETFATYTSNILRNRHHIQAIVWAPRVSGASRSAYEAAMQYDGLSGYRFTELTGDDQLVEAGARDEYFPAYYIEPIDGNQRALGLDLAARPELREALDRARDRESTAGAGRVNLAGLFGEAISPGEEFGAVAFKPVYQKLSTTQTVEQRRTNLVGFVAVVFQVAPLIEETLRNANVRGMDVYLFDRATDPKENFLYYFHPLSSTAQARIVGEAEARTGLHVASNIDLADQQWTAVFKPVAGQWHSERPWQVWGVLAAGLIFTSVLVGYLLLTIARKSQMERLAGEISESNARLEGEIEERERTEQALRKSEYQIRLVTDSLPVLITYIDSKERYRFANKMAESWYHRPTEALLGKSIHAVVGDDAYATLRPHVEKVLSGRQVNFEESITYPDGASRDVVGVFVPDTGDHDNVLGFFSLVRDVTGEKQTKARLHQAQKMESIGQLTGGIAHDFNNLLSVVIGNLQLLERRVDGDDRARNCLEAASGAAMRGAQLTKRLLAFSRNQVLEPKVLDVNELVLGMDKLLHRTLGEQIEIQTLTSDDLWLPRVDPNELENVVLNLAINARDAMPGGGKLTIETCNAVLDEAYAGRHAEVTAGDYVKIAVSDTGAGIPREIIERVFDPFFTTKESGKGSGLGLSMVHGFVKQSGGHIKIYSEEGHGTTLRIYLPRTEALAAPEATTMVGRSNELPKGNETVLVVEDQHDVRDTAVALLEDLGYRVLTAENGQSALDMLKTNNGVDLLFTDIVMPGGMNGDELARQVRMNCADIKVLYTSGFTEHAVARGGKLQQGVELITKPYLKKDLARKVRRVLDA